MMDNIDRVLHSALVCFGTYLFYRVVFAIWNKIKICIWPAKASSTHDTTNQESIDDHGQTSAVQPKNNTAVNIGIVVLVLIVICMVFVGSIYGDTTSR